MSHHYHNYMDDVPVKISERYKPPPQLYQVPVGINQKLSFPPSHFDESYAYNFQLERKVLVTVAELRRVRHLEKEARRSRQMRRDQLRIQQIEEQHKQMLTSVNYPSTEELSSSSESETGTPTKSCSKQVESSTAAVVNCFDNILQPTIIHAPLNSDDLSLATTTWKNSNMFNYKDFEVDTSSPFDNIELKSINDLDVLAQVLNNTQIHSNEITISNDNKANSSRKLEKDTGETQIENCINLHCVVEETSDDISIKQCKAALQKVDFNYEEENIPEPTSVKEHTPPHLPQFTQFHGNYYFHPTTNETHSTLAWSNGISSNSHLNSINNAVQLSSDSRPKEPMSDAEFALQSKSVPDILRELSDEVRNSEMRRRSRNHSYNVNEELSNHCEDAISPKDCEDSTKYFTELTAPHQELAKYISSMGFPLERVSKVSQMFDGDDKKIFEHLIPLSELIDLGFNEAKISEALVKFDNNKEKALEYLIS